MTSRLGNVFIEVPSFGGNISTLPVISSPALGELLLCREQTGSRVEMRAIGIERGLQTHQPERPEEDMLG